MKKILLALAAILITSSLAAQNLIFPKLKKEDVNFQLLYDQTNDENYILYKYATTVPLSIRKTVDQNYVLKNFNWDEIFPDNSKNMVRIASQIVANITLRKPTDDEKKNFVYLQADISIDSLPFIEESSCIVRMKTKNNENIRTETISLLSNMSLAIQNNLTNDSQERVNFGTLCEVKTVQKENMISFILAFEIARGEFDDLSGGSLSIRFLDLIAPTKRTITKSDVGKSILINDLICDVLAFTDGALHLRYTSKANPNEFKFIGSIGDDKFKIKTHRSVIIYPVYKRYITNSSLNYEKFQKLTSGKKNIDFDPRDMSYNVMVYNIGYDLDSLSVIVPDAKLISYITCAVSIRKTDGNVSFAKIFNDSQVQFSGYTNENYVNLIRNYFRKNVIYPSKAVNNQIKGAVIFKFTLTAEGAITNVQIVSSPDNSLSQEVIRVARSAPVFKRPEGMIKIDHVSTMKLEFNL